MSDTALQTNPFVQASSVTIQTLDGSGIFDGLYTTPQGGRGQGIVLIQEIFGVNDFIRDTAKMLASAGFTVLAPDLFWRLERNVELDASNEADFAKALDLMGQFDIDQGIEDLKASVAHLRSLNECEGDVGCVGYCLGGRLAYLLATRSDVSASVGYYGVTIPDYMDEAGNITKPLLLHVAEEDGFVSKDEQAALHAGLDGNELVTIHDYAGRDHGFARVGGDAYDADDANLANVRTVDFFHQHLRKYG